MFSALKNCMDVFPGPYRNGILLYDSKHMHMNLTRREVLHIRYLLGIP